MATEAAFARFCDTQHSIAVSSGTDALRFAIMACDVEPGSVVLTVPNTFIATTEAISQAGAIPEFIDIDERTYNLSPVMLKQYLEHQCIRDSSGKLISMRSGRPVAAGRGTRARCFASAPCRASASDRRALC